MKLSNPNAIAPAVRLYEYLCEMNGKRCLTGQMESQWCGTAESEMNYLLMATGRYPAIRGLDFIDNDFPGVVRRAREWWARGGIPSICWHTGPDFASSYKECQENDLDWDAAFTEGSDAHRRLIEAMDRAAAYLQRLDRMGVPVLWRPFHEFDGGWFWWGRGGAEGFIRLWRTMYDRYTNHWKLNNLIWVLGYAGEGRGMADWYPGDQYVDILGVDSYTPGAHGDLYEKCRAIAPQGMPLCFHECGTIPTWEQMQGEKAPWLWFMVWHTRWLTSDEFNTREGLREIYHNPHFVTLTQLPDFLTEGETC